MRSRVGRGFRGRRRWASERETTSPGRGAAQAAGGRRKTGIPGASRIDGTRLGHGDGEHEGGGGEADHRVEHQREGLACRFRGGRDARGAAAQWRRQPARNPSPCSVLSQARGRPALSRLARKPAGRQPQELTGRAAVVAPEGDDLAALRHLVVVPDVMAWRQWGLGGSITSQVGGGPARLRSSPRRRPAPCRPLRTARRVESKAAGGRVPQSSLKTEPSRPHFAKYAKIWRARASIAMPPCSGAGGSTRRRLAAARSRAGPARRRLRSPPAAACAPVRSTHRRGPRHLVSLPLDLGLGRALDERPEACCWQEGGEGCTGGWLARAYGAWQERRRLARAAHTSQQPPTRPLLLPGTVMRKRPRLT